MSNNEDESNFKDELKSIKEEMKELKAMLKQKAENQEEDDEDINIGGRHRSRDRKSRNFRIHIDDDDFQFEGIDETLGDYLNSVMEGVAESLTSSMSQMAKGFKINIDDIDRAKHDLEKEKHNIKREMHRVKREAKKAAREADRMARDVRRQVIRYQKLSEEELVRFYEIAPSLTSALSDEKKLKLLKTLETGPKYQKDLSEETEIVGGTFKHHMDALQEMQYVSQETVRGRYLITRLGVEALKLAEMLFRRYIFVTEEEAEERSEDLDVDMDLDEDIDVDIDADMDADIDADLDADIDVDIQDDADAVNNMQHQNEEEEG